MRLYKSLLLLTLTGLSSCRTVECDSADPVCNPGAALYFSLFTPDLAEWMTETAAYQGFFIGVRDDNTISWSYDGERWAAASVEIDNPSDAANNDIQGITWSETDHSLVAVGLSGYILYSADGKTWKQYSSGVTDNLKSVAWGNGKFIAVGCKQDGGDATQCSGDNAGDPASGPVILESPDGKIWSNTSSNMSIFQNSVSLYRIIYFDDYFAAAGRTSAAVGEATFYLQNQTWYKNAYETNTSLDESTLPDIAAAGLFTGDLMHFNNSLWLAGFTTGGDLNSLPLADGIENAKWLSKGQTAIPSLVGMTSGNDSIIIVGDLTAVYMGNKSGQSFSVQDSNDCDLTDELRSVAFGNNRFVAAGENGIVCYNKDGDGKKWLNADLTPGKSFNKIIFYPYGE